MKKSLDKGIKLSYNIHIINQRKLHYDKIRTV
jgi:hypothetical protein